MKARPSYITRAELIAVLHSMDFNGRKDGYIVRDLQGKLLYFETKPPYGGSEITREQLVKLINETPNTR